MFPNYVEINSDAYRPILEYTSICRTKSKVDFVSQDLSVYFLPALPYTPLALNISASEYYA